MGAATDRERDSMDPEALSSWPGWSPEPAPSALDDANRTLADMGSRLDTLTKAVERASSSKNKGAPTAILVFDDGACFEELRAALSTIPGVEVLRVDSPAAALQVAPARFVRLFVVDADGPEALGLIRDLHDVRSDAPVIAVTDAAEDTALAAGAAAVLRRASAATGVRELAAQYLAH